MLVTVIGKYKGHYDEELKLTMSQRTLMLQTVSFLFYLLLGAAVYKHIEDWEYLDAVYWADNTILTVGLGDYVPTTNLGRGLLIPFAIGGIITSGLIVSSIRSLVVERGKVIAGARTVEKQRRRALRKLQKQNETAVLTPIYSEPDTQIGLRTSLGTFSAKQDGLTERQRRKQEFELMRQVQDNAINKRRWFSLLISGSVWFMLWLVSAFIFTVTEEAQSWSYFESVYFAYTSLLTIGYGDFHPESNAGKAFFVFWSLLAIPSLTILISNMGDTIVKVIRDVTLWVGVFTILPAEKGVKNTFKRAAIKMSKRKKIDVKETSSDMVRETNHDGQRSDGQRSQDSNLGSATGAARCMFSSAERDGIENKPNFLLRKEKDRHCLLIKEIGTVMTHVNSSPSRKYTFDEWAWYLELLGEDESDASTHKNPLGRPNLGGEGLAIAIPGRCGNERGQGEKKRAKWSWIGEQSPLMGNKEESEWLLERLTKTLEMELESMRLSIISDDLS